MPTEKKAGRPREFDIDTALLAAMNIFWSKGYDATSLKDLTSAMGISGPSLYSAFGDKRNLYLKAIDRYSDVNACEPIIAFESEPDIRKAVLGFFRAIIDYTTDHTYGNNGCFLASCVSTTVGEVEGVAERLDMAIASTDNRLAARFDAEKAKGNLPQDFPSMERGQLMFDMRQGIVFRGRAGASKECLLAGLENRVDMILMGA